MSSKPKITIIIVHFKNLDLLADCLRSCESITYPNWDILVVKNGAGSQPDHNQMSVWSTKINEVISLRQNVGFARANNVGIQKAMENGSEYVLLLNDDTMVSPDFLEKLQSAADGPKPVGMVGPQIYFFDDPRRIWFAGARLNERNCEFHMIRGEEMDMGGQDGEEQIATDYITGCALLIKRNVIESVGLMDDRFFLYWEDADWGWRARKAGFNHWVLPKARIWHKISKSSGGPDSPLKAYHKTRSHFLFAKLHFSHLIYSLHRKFFRDVAWLLLKSSDNDRILKAMALLCAVLDFHRNISNKGPEWLWRSIHV